MTVYIGALSLSALLSDDDAVLPVMAGCCAALVASFGLFLLSIDHSHVRNYFDTRSSAAYQQ